MPVIGDLHRFLRTVTRDSWHIELRQINGNVATIVRPDSPSGSCLLFSGGLDFLGGAVSLLGQEPLQLVSHRSGNPRIGAAQRRLKEMIREAGFSFGDVAIEVTSKSDRTTGFKHDAEASQRSRSIVYLVIGVLVACRTGYTNRLYIAENGQLAVHLPFTQGRIGANSTHTADPLALKIAESIFEQILGFRIEIINPFMTSTKAEIVSHVAQDLPDAIAVSNSCFSASHLPAGATHCGICVPCLTRRVAIETSTSDSTAYARDIFEEEFAALDSDDTGRRNLSDFAEFVSLAGSLSDQEFMDEWPELHNDPESAPDVIAMYRRFSAEAIGVLGTHPNLGPLLS